MRDGAAPSARRALVIWAALIENRRERCTLWVRGERWRVCLGAKERNEFFLKEGVRLWSRLTNSL